MRQVLLHLILLTLSCLPALVAAVPLHTKAEASLPSHVDHVSQILTLPTYPARKSGVVFKLRPAGKEASALPDSNSPPTDEGKKPDAGHSRKRKKGKQDGGEKQPGFSNADAAADGDENGKKDDAPHKSDPDPAEPADAKKQPEAKGRDDAREDPNEQDAAEPDAGEVDKAKPDDAETDDARPDDAKPEDAKPVDAKPDDTSPDDSRPDGTKPEDIKPGESKPNDTSSDEGSPSKPESVPEVPKADASKDKEPAIPRVSSPVMTGNAPLIGLIAFAVAVLIGGFVVGTRTSLCGFRRASDGQQYEPLSRQDGAQMEGRFGEMPSDLADADGWNDGWEQDDWDAEEAAKA